MKGGGGIEYATTFVFFQSFVTFCYFSVYVCLQMLIFLKKK